MYHSILESVMKRTDCHDFAPAPAEKKPKMEDKKVAKFVLNVLRRRDSPRLFQRTWIDLSNTAWEKLQSLEKDIFAAILDERQGEFWCLENDIWVSTRLYRGKFKVHIRRWEASKYFPDDCRIPTKIGITIPAEEFTTVMEQIKKIYEHPISIQPHATDGNCLLCHETEIKHAYHFDCPVYRDTMQFYLKSEDGTKYLKVLEDMLLMKIQDEIRKKCFGCAAGSPTQREHSYLGVDYTLNDIRKEQFDSYANDMYFDIQRMYFIQRIKAIQLEEQDVFVSCFNNEMLFIQLKKAAKDWVIEAARLRFLELE